MKPDSIAFALAGMVFGLLPVGSSARSPRPRAPCRLPAWRRPRPAAVQQAQQPAPPPLNESDVEKYRKLAEAEPTSVAPRVALANLYFDAERYSDAVKWYEEAMKLDTRNADISTDLGVSYYY